MIVAVLCYFYYLALYPMSETLRLVVEDNTDVFVDDLKFIVITIGREGLMSVLQCSYRF